MDDLDLDVDLADALTLPWAMLSGTRPSSTGPLRSTTPPPLLARASGSLAHLLSKPTPLSPAESEGLDAVAAGLYIASGRAASRLSSLRAAGVTHVVNAAPSVELCYHQPALVRQ
jgi:hypothetical protein